MKGRFSFKLKEKKVTVVEGSDFEGGEEEENHSLKTRKFNPSNSEIFREGK